MKELSQLFKDSAAHQDSAPPPTAEGWEDLAGRLATPPPSGWQTLTKFVGGAGWKALIVAGIVGAAVVATLSWNVREGDGNKTVEPALVSATNSKNEDDQEWANVMVDSSGLAEGVPYSGQYKIPQSNREGQLSPNISEPPRVVRAGEGRQSGFRSEVIGNTGTDFGKFRRKGDSPVNIELSVEPGSVVLDESEAPLRPMSFRLPEKTRSGFREAPLRGATGGTYWKGVGERDKSVADGDRQTEQSTFKEQNIPSRFRPVSHLSMRRVERVDARSPLPNNDPVLADKASDLSSGTWRFQPVPAEERPLARWVLSGRMAPWYYEGNRSFTAVLSRTVGQSRWQTYDLGNGETIELDLDSEGFSFIKTPARISVPYRALAFGREWSNGLRLYVNVWNYSTDHRIRDGASLLATRFSEEEFVRLHERYFTTTALQLNCTYTFRKRKRLRYRVGFNLSGAALQTETRKESIYVSGGNRLVTQSETKSSEIHFIPDESWFIYPSLGVDYQLSRNFTLDVVAEPFPGIGVTYQFY